MIRSVLTRMKMSVMLLVERRVLLFTVIDCAFLFFGFSAALMGSGYASQFYPFLFLAPALLLGVPMLADCVAVERRSGTLDLALTSPSAGWYFERRIASGCALVLLQGWLTIVLMRAVSEPFAVRWAMAQMVVVTTFLGATVLNWAVRLRTSGGVVIATYATTLVFAPWFFSNPVRSGYEFQREMDAADILEWATNNVVLLGAAVIFTMYAAQRLMRPEEIVQ